MGGIQRPIAEADMRAARILADLGRELRSARRSRGLSQASVGAAARVTQSQVSRLERALLPHVTTQVLARAAAAVGLELSVKLYPGGQPLRDRAHVALLARFRAAVGEHWRWAAEVPLPIQGDKRAWDRVLDDGRVRIGAEGETKPTDAQELQRRLALKKRDAGVDRLVLVLADTSWNRRVVRQNDFTTTFPVPGRVALKALREGRDPGGDAVILI